MWMLRLLPGMGPGVEVPPSKQTAGKTMIKLKPSHALPPANMNAKAIVNQFKEDIYEYHKISGGRVDLIHTLFCHIAEHNGKPPIPPQSMAALLELTMAEMQEVPCIVSEVQLLSAFTKMVKPDDTGENFETKVISVLRDSTKRSKHAAEEVEKLRPAFQELHEACKGSAVGLYSFFMDLLPEEHRRQYNPAMWNVMVMKVPQNATHIPFEHFVTNFQESMDTTDTAETIRPHVTKHIALNKDPEAAAAHAAQAAKTAAAAAVGPPPGPPQTTQHQIAIVDKYTAQIAAFHKTSGGRISQIHTLFISLAENLGLPPPPPRAMAGLLELTQEEARVSPCVAPESKLIKAFQKLVRPDMTAEEFETKVISVVVTSTQRSEHGAKEIETLRPPLSKLHEASGGAARVLFEFFIDLLPEEQRATFGLDAFNVHVLRVHPQTEKVSLDHFLQAFQDTIDTTDNAVKILPVLTKHIDKFTSGAAHSDSTKDITEPQDTKEPEESKESA